MHGWTGSPAAEDLVDADAQDVLVAVRLEEGAELGQIGRLALRRLVFDVEEPHAVLDEGPHAQDGKLQLLDVNVHIVDDCRARKVLSKQRPWCGH